METTVLDLPAILAAVVDEALADEWGSPPVAGFLLRGQCATEIRLVSVTEPVALGLMPMQATAAVLSALGWASKAVSDARERVRMTVAVTCCGSAGVMRWPERPASVAEQIDGALVADLRRRAGLACAHPSGGRISTGMSTGSLPDG